MEVLKQLLGRLHPIVVHLPIGFLLLGLLLLWYDRKQRKFDKVLPLIFLWGLIGAVLACITGYLQYLGEGYAFETVKWHLWLGLGTALLSLLMFLRIAPRPSISWLQKIPLLGLSMVFFLLISITGHKGGQITHGAAYLVEPLPNSVKSVFGIATFEEQPIVLTEANWQDAQLYGEVIRPILNNNCVSCHNPKKKKGELQLQSPETILQGGENGDVLVAGKASESDMVKRMRLPKNDEDHMPPKDKTQPTKAEIDLVAAWIDIGHPFDKSIKETGLQKELFLPFFPEPPSEEHPELKIAPASADSIQKVRDLGIHVDQLHENTSFLKVSCLNRPDFTDADFQPLLALKQQIAVLDLGGTQITDAIMEKLAQLPHLTVLKLDHTAITGSALDQLATLENLKSINLSSSKFDASSLHALLALKYLEKAYVFDTPMASEGIRQLQHDRLQIDYGSYELPPISSDSVVY
jgi:uncharacterized membrane protein/mono/diheme cytochrome c family protein